jgi:hypothetical protein
MGETGMRIQDFERVYDANASDEIDSAMAKRYGSGVNAFWLSHGSSKYPSILILVNGDLASLHYFPEEGHPGFRSVGTVQGLEPGGTTAFFMNNVKEEQPILNDSIVPLSTALKAAKEFSASTELPHSVEWFEL